MWLCAACRACVIRCSCGVNIVNVMGATRRLLVEYEVVRRTLRRAPLTLRTLGNSWGDVWERRGEWAEALA